MKTRFPLLVVMLLTAMSCCTSPLTLFSPEKVVARQDKPAALITATSGRFQLKADKVYPAYTIVKITADNVPAKAGVIWRISPNAKVSKATSSAKTQLEFVAPPGDYAVEVLVVSLSADGSTDIQESSISVKIETPDGPAPVPVPPVDPAPIPVAGLRVLIIYETADIAKMSPAHQYILYSEPMRSYLNSKCVKGPDNKTSEWQVWDKDTDVSGMPKLWQDVMKRPRKSVPWIVVSNGKTGYEGELPPDVATTQALITKYAG